MIAEEPKMSKEQQAESDGYTLIRAEETRQEALVIRKDKKRFAAAGAYIKADNKRRAEAMKKEMAARSKAVG